MRTRSKPTLPLLGSIAILCSTAVAWLAAAERDSGEERTHAGRVRSNNAASARVAGAERQDARGEQVRAASGLSLVASLRVEKGARVMAVAFAAQAKQFAAVSQTGNVYVWDRATLKLHRKFSHFQPASNAVWPKHGLSCACFSPDGAKICLGDCTEHLALWEVAAGKLVALKDFDEFAVVCAIDVSDESKLVAVAGFDYSPSFDAFGIVQIWNPGTGQLGTIKPNAAKRCVGVAFQPGGHLVAVKSESDSPDPTPNCDRYSLWNKNSLSCYRELPFAGSYGDVPRFDTSGRHLVVPVARADGSAAIRYWDVPSNKLFRDVESGPMLAIAPGIEGFIAPFASELRYFDLEGSRARNFLTFSSLDELTVAQLSPDGALLLVGTSLGNVYLLSVPSKPLARPRTMPGMHENIPK